MDQKSSCPGKVRKWANILLAVCFIGFIFTFFGASLIQHWEGIYDSARLMSKLSAYLPENYGTLDMLNARIRSVESSINENLWLHEEWGYFNSSFQYALGKQMVNTGGSNMVVLEDGCLHDLQSDYDTQRAADEIIALAQSIQHDVPFLFVYEHPTLYNQEMLPAGFEALDYANETADEVMDLLYASGINCMDSRAVLNNCGLPMDQLLMRTDQHWSTLAAIVMAQEIVVNLNETAGLGLDPALLNLEMFETQTYEGLFLGKYGQRVGPQNVRPDDITVYWPTYETYIYRHTNQDGTVTEAEGAFREAVIKWEKLNPLPGRTWNKNAYVAYGLVEDAEIFRNENAPVRTILLFRDSYSAPIGAFLSLTAENVITIDLRKTSVTAAEFIERYNPDAVIVAYSLQMLRNDAYQFQ